MLTKAGLTVVYCIGGMFPFLLNCKPMSGYWDKTLQPKPVCMALPLFIKLGVLNTGLFPRESKVQWTYC